MKKIRYHVFTVHPTYRLDLITETVEERERKVAGHRETYPDIPVYWTEVHE